jgi:hypothetical protein
MILKAAGVEGAEPTELRSTYLEIVNQAAAGLARALTSRLNREVSPAGGAEQSVEPGASTTW